VILAPVLRTANDARALLATALGVLVAAALSQALAVGDGSLRLLWLPTSVGLVAILSGGRAMAVPAAIAGAAWASWRGLSPEAAAWSGAACSLAPLAAAEVLGLWSRRYPSQSQFVTTVRLMAVIGAVLAPLAALLGMQAGPELPVLGAAPPRLRFAAALAVEAASAVVAVRALMSLMPERGGGFCPIEAVRKGPGGLARSEWTCWGVMVAALLASTTAIGLDHGTVARFALMVAFTSAIVAALLGNRRNTSTMLLVAILCIVALRGRVEPFSADVAYLVGLGQFVLLAGVGGLVAHLLNAISSERIGQAARLRELAMTNEISGLPNLRAFEEALDACLRAPGHAGLQLLEVGIAEMDRWADLAGRAAAQRIERLAGEALRDAFATGAACVAHIGSGRYALALHGGIPDEVLRARVQGAIDRHRLEAGADQVAIRCHAGVVDLLAHHGPGHDGEALLAAMSLALQRAQDSPDRFHRLELSGTVLEDYRQRLRETEAVRDAVGRGRIRLLGQPIVAADGSAGGLHYEVLARLLDAEGRDIPPAVFLPALARMRLLEIFDRLVVVRTLYQLATDDALRACTALCAINLTGPSLSDPGFPAFLFGKLDEARLDPRMFALEITESDSIPSLDVAMRNNERLKQGGLTMALDDFGTGLATFDYLRRFAPHWVKVDGSFVRSVDEGPLGRQIIDSIVRVARAAGARTVAECVETPALAASMRTLGVDYLQGWGIARPMPIEALAAFHLHGAAQAARADAAPAATAPATAG
jgi:EAL domain-containing protein (putative c-di-GMP-specific phosphodiesterase class I)/GGDEF domain-containing protein